MTKVTIVACPLCTNRGDFFPLRISSRDDHIQKHGQLYGGAKVSEWKVCGVCGFVHQNPRPSTEALRDFYLSAMYHPPDIPWTPADYVRFGYWYYKEKVDYALRLCGIPTGAVFDAGCGLGGALKVFADYGWRTYGLEPDQTQAEFAAQQVGLNGVRHGIVDARVELTEPVDLVFSNHAFEHFCDLDDVMTGIARILRPGGYIFTAVPTYFSNRSSLAIRWMNSAHYSMFTHSSLNHLLGKYGFQEVGHTYRGWHKEIDDLWHVAQFTGERVELANFYEDAAAVQRYVNYVTRARAFFYWPLYSHYDARVRLATTMEHVWHMFRSSPRVFFKKVQGRLVGRRAGAPRGGRG